MQQLTIEDAYPGLRRSGYEVTSEISDLYNCIAWAAGDDTNWWGHSPGHYWPPGVPRSPEISSLVQVFEILGFSTSDSQEIEPGYDKVGVYAQSGEWTHAARQLANGKWTSKVGQFEDITHPTLDNLVGDAYGSVHCIMRRPASDS